MSANENSETTQRKRLQIHYVKAHSMRLPLPFWESDVFNTVIVSFPVGAVVRCRDLKITTQLQGGLSNVFTFKISQARIQHVLIELWANLQLHCSCFWLTAYFSDRLLQSDTLIFKGTALAAYKPTTFTKLVVPFKKMLNSHKQFFEQLHFVIMQYGVINDQGWDCKNDICNRVIYYNLLHLSCNNAGRACTPQSKAHKCNEKNTTTRLVSRLV